MKILILIISSTGFPYDEYKELWREYMNLDKDIDSYFIESKDIEESSIDNDTIYIKGVESYEKIFYKTQEALKLFDLNKYDYIFRTNLSSFILFSKYKEWLKTVGKEKVYNGSISWYSRYIYASGCGFTITPDVAQMIINYDEESKLSKFIDDVTVGRVCMINGIKVSSAPLNCIFSNTFDYETDQFDDYECAFHFRTKMGGDRKDDLAVYKKLLDMYYPFPESL
jgi:hypothetical protein